MTRTSDLPTSCISPQSDTHLRPTHAVPLAASHREVLRAISESCAQLLMAQQALSLLQTLLPSVSEIDAGHADQIGCLLRAADFVVGWITTNSNESAIAQPTAREFRQAQAALVRGCYTSAGCARGLIALDAALVRCVGDRLG